MDKELLIEIENSLQTPSPLQWEAIMARTGLSFSRCLMAWYDYIAEKN